MIRYLSTILLATVLVSALATPAVADSPKPAKVTLTDEQRKLFEEGLTQDEARQLADEYLESLTATYAETYEFPPALVELLGADTRVRNIFVSALDPANDDIKRAAQIFDDLRSIDPQRVTKYAHLATAIAVVYDQPAIPTRELGILIWGVGAGQFPPPVAYRDIYDYYSDPPKTRTFAYPPDKLPWPMQVYIIDNGVAPDERAWAHEKFNRSVQIGGLYQRVAFDYDKLAKKKSRLGTRAYTLKNVLRFGGVCGDQAYFASRVAKCFSVPAMAVRGVNRYGNHHAWLGYLTSLRGRALLHFSGRYLNDYYYTGDVQDPQTGGTILDRHVAMMFDGLSVSYEKYELTRILIRLADQLQADEPDLSVALVEGALDENPYMPNGWRVLMAHFRAKALTKEQALQWFNIMLKVLKNHPDMTFECLKTYLASYPQKDFASRRKLYGQALNLYTGRPDLQFKLLLDLANEMVAADQKEQALKMLINPIVRYAKEGSVVIPAMQLAVRLATELKVQKKAHSMLSRALSTFPKRRSSNDSPSEVYKEFEALLNQLEFAFLER